MKRIIFLLLAGITLASCTDEDTDEEALSPTSPSLTLRKGCEGLGNIRTFPSSEALEEAIEGDFNGSGASLCQLDGKEFVSLMDEVRANDPALDTLSQEDKDYILKNHLTYYDAFGYEDLVPNEDFASILSKDGEVLVNDTVYKITEQGTLCAAATNYNSLTAAADSLNKKKFFFVDGELQRKLANDVLFINSFSNNTDFMDSPSGISGNRQFTDGLPATGVIGTNHPNPTTPPAKDTPLEDIPFGEFPSFDTESHTIVAPIGRLLRLGDRSSKHHEFIRHKRVNGSLYCYNYKVYHEAGAYVSMSRKRGGVLKWINGWKDIDADELVMDLQGVVFMLKLDVPANMREAMERNTKVYGYSTRKDFSLSGKMVNILGYDIKEEQVYKWAGMGLKQALRALSSLTGTNIDANTKSAQILTPDKAYILIFEDPVHVHNCKKYRRVFDSGVQFCISSDIIKHPFKVNTWKDYIALYDHMPRLGLVAGKARLAGQIDGKWGGMVIEKKRK